MYFKMLSTENLNRVLSVKPSLSCVVTGQNFHVATVLFS